MAHLKTVILCGGIGYRLKEETEFKPKPMVQIGGKPILWHIMKIYAHYGFNEFIVALGYKGDYIKDYFLNQQYFSHNFSINTKSGYSKIYRQDDGRADDFKITFVDTGEEATVGERILGVRSFVEPDEEFMLTYGDGVTDLNIKELVKFHKQQKTIGTLIGVHPRSKYGLLSVGRTSKAEKLIEKPILRDWTNGGFMVFKKEVFSYFHKGEMEHPALKRLIKKNQLSVFKYPGFWHCMDTYADVDSLNRLWQQNPPWKVWR